MGSHEADFLRQLRDAFKVEASEHLQTMIAGLLELEKTAAPEAQAPLVESVFREAHSLKGAARAVNLKDVESLCQAMEGVFAGWKKGPPPEAFDTLQEALDVLGRLVADPDLEAADRAQLERLLRRLSHPAEAGPAGWAPAPDAPVREPAAVERPAVLDTVRISTAKLDRLILEAEEMLAVKMTAAQRVAELREVQVMLEHWNHEWMRVQPEVRASRPAADRQAPPPTPEHVRLLEFLAWNEAYVCALEEKVQAISRTAAQDRYIVGKWVDELLEDSKKLLMLPFATLLGALPKVVRDLCRDEGKEASLSVRGGEVEIDKRILEEMKDPLLHLVRNCIDHGIEPPGERVRGGKPPAGSVVVAVSRTEDNQVELLVSDDGAGIDLGRVRESAVRHGVVPGPEAGRLNDREALGLIFQSEVSTSPTVTEISGRGLGLAIVREKTARLGGSVSVESLPRRGTAFRIRLPVTLATFRGILVGVAGRTYVIPTTSVERVGRVKREEIRTVEHSETVTLHGRLLSFARLEDLLELDTRRAELPAVVLLAVLAAGEQRIALAVDEVLREEEVLVKRLGSPLGRVRNLAGATVLGSGLAVPILNVADLVKSALKFSAADPRPAAAKAAPGPHKSILVVEDSITARILLKGILESGGYQVRTAVDGADAWEILRTGAFDAVVSDVDMPRMNGFELTARIRADRKWGGIPVVLVTALASREDQAHGLEVGATAYIVKSSFEQSNLLQELRQRIG